MNVMLRRHKFDFDLIVIGSGAGGSVGAHFAHSMGKKVAVFEKAEVGGECPNWACVPTKALLHAARVYQSAQNAQAFGVDLKAISVNFHQVNRWRNLVVSRTGATHGEEIFQKEGLHLIKGQAQFVSRNEVSVDDKVYSADKILIASGSEVFIPPILGLKKTGYLTFKKAGDLEKLPSSIFILGGGPVGCEFAQIFSSFGAKVMLADVVNKLLLHEDTEVSNLIQALFENQGIEILTGVNVTKVEKKNRMKVVHYKKGDTNHQVEVEEILIASGKRPVLDFGVDKVGIAIEHGRIKTNKYLQTTAPNIYAAGDVVGPYQFTHTGEYQSYIAVANAFSKYKKIKCDYSAIPKCVFTFPEVASVGFTEKEAGDMHIKIKVGIAPTAQVGRANTSNEFDGFVKVITDSKERIIGASIVAPTAGEMIHELMLAVKLKVTAKTIAELPHAYPTFSETIKFACSSLESR